MEIFKGESIITFFDTFKTDMDYLRYLSEKKWSQGYTCKKCGNKTSTIRKKNLTRDCNKCHYIESPTTDTLFHKVRFGYVQPLQWYLNEFSYRINRSIHKQSIFDNLILK